MNAVNVAMGAAGLLASVITGAISVRYSRNDLSRSLLARIRLAAQNLLGGKELDSFFVDYFELLTALGKLAGTQCLVFLIFTLPSVAIYQLTSMCFQSYGFQNYPSAMPTNSGAWFAADEWIFVGAFMVGSLGAFVRRRM